ncbi:molecular chaperone TorD family protein [Campylobacter hyointestinalis]|uniref:molecular chaperone TorD family protein n=1 Tax=Campylobacter hyointestinalis TaxID=198 RepID=UPI000DCDF4D3|nr:molecular chaperone TorD family protein [Campylobacter hyointestinalis]RAZ49828.1 formate dehydrogenase-specific chaperone [Campylobacter hyointestinalis subsp. lawsonii]
MSDLDVGRSYYYEFLAYPLFFDENGLGFKSFLEQVHYLAKSPIDESNISDFETILGFDFDKFKNEQNSVFFDLSYVNVPLSASFYDEGRDDGNKRLKVMEILKSSDFRRNSQKCKVSEDYIGFIFRLMATFLKSDLKLSRELFEKIINDFSDEFTKMLSEHKAANFFKAYANIYRNFIALERSILGIKAPIFEKSMAEISMSKKPYQTKMPTQKSKINWDEFTAI